MESNNTVNQAHRYCQETKKILRQHTCLFPFMKMHIYEDGSVYPCPKYWNDVSYGNILENDLPTMLDNRLAKKLQVTSLNGQYLHCNSKVCPNLSELLSGKENSDHFIPNNEDVLLNIQNKIQKNGIDIWFNYESSCNLSCPSCREELLTIKLSNVPEKILQIHEQVSKSIQKLLEKGFIVNTCITGSGDPFSSPLYWNYLNELSYHPQQFITLLTNGLLMTEERLKRPYHRMLRFISVSVDAGTPKTYQKIRRGGHFNILKDNLKNLDQLIQQGHFPVLRGWQINFLVQAGNYQEIPQFLEWALSHSTLAKVSFSFIVNWGHISKENFSTMAIWREEHPEHKHFLQSLQHPLLQHEKVSLGNLSHFISSHPSPGEPEQNHPR